jgi:hypothetical protein
MGKEIELSETTLEKFIGNIVQRDYARKEIELARLR